MSKVKEKMQKIDGANMDIDLTTDSSRISWKQQQCPWNASDGTSEHKCAVKNTSICDYFCGIRPLDTVMCSYPKKIKN